MTGNRGNLKGVCTIALAPFHADESLARFYVERGVIGSARVRHPAPTLDGETLRELDHLTNYLGLEGSP